MMRILMYAGRPLGRGFGGGSPQLRRGRAGWDRQRLLSRVIDLAFFWYIFRAWRLDPAQDLMIIYGNTNIRIYVPHACTTHIIDKKCCRKNRSRLKVALVGSKMP